MQFVQLLNIDKQLAYLQVFYCPFTFLQRFGASRNSLNLPPAFGKWREVLFWVPSPSPRMFCLISRLLLKLAV